MLDNFSVSPNTTIVNEEGTFYLEHDTKRWGAILSGDMLTPREGLSNHEQAQRLIDEYLMGTSYAMNDWKENFCDLPLGEEVDHTEFNGEGVTIYDFTRHEGQYRYKCWLRDLDRRVMRMEVYETEHGALDLTYEINYDVPPHESFYVLLIPDDYTNSQLIGYGNHPYLMNPDVAAVIQDEDSAQFYRLTPAPGQNRQEAIELEIAKGKPVFEIRVIQPMTVIVEPSQPGLPPDEDPYAMTIGAVGYVGNLMYGVLLPSQKTIITSSAYTDQGKIIFEYLAYRTDYAHCKLLLMAMGMARWTSGARYPLRMSYPIGVAR